MNDFNRRLDEEPLTPFSAMSALHRLFSFLSAPAPFETGKISTRTLLYLCLAGCLAATAADVLLVLVLRVAIDRYVAPGTVTAPLSEQRIRGLALTAVVFALMYVINMLFKYLVVRGFSEVGLRLIGALRRALWVHLHRLPISYFDENPVGRIVTRITNDIAAVDRLFTDVVAFVPGDIILIPATLTIMFVFSPDITCYILAILIPIIFLSIWYTRILETLQRLTRDLLARINAFLQENLDGISLIKSYTAERRQQSRFQALNADAYRVDMQSVHAATVFRLLVTAGMMLSIAVVVWIGGTQVYQETLSLGTFIAMLVIVRFMFVPLETLTDKFTVIQQTLIALERVFRVLDRPVEPGWTESVKAVPRAHGHVRFDNVSFAYDPDKPVLSNVSFEIRPGENVALVGPSASGKTTIASLLLGLYGWTAPQSASAALARHNDRAVGAGCIYLDDVPLAAWDVRALRRQFALVGQDPWIFAADLRRNLSLYEKRDDAVLMAALRTVHAFHLVDRFEDGLDHVLNPRGTELSQGERQLISIARALVVDAPVLILDEATASVDSKTEQAIQAGLRAAVRGHTSLVIAHRLSTIMEADRILVLEKGRIVEQGTHAGLLARNGLYALMFHTQRL